MPNNSAARQTARRSRFLSRARLREIGAPNRGSVFPIARPDLAAEVGIGNEDRVEEALRILVEEGHIYGFYRTQPYGELDLQGVDFQIYVSRYRLMNLQVKSSKIGRDKHEEINGNLIPCVVVTQSMSLEDIKERVRNEVERTILHELDTALRKAQGEQTQEA